MATADEVTYFDRARQVAVVLLLAAGAACVIGGVMGWATLERCPEIIPGTSFEESELEEPPPCPVRGIDTTEGKVAIAAGFATLGSSILLTLRKRASFAWLALVGAVVAGSSAISAYRGVGDANSSISRRMGLIDAFEPGTGLILTTAAAIVGVMAAVGAIAATPHVD